MREPAIVRFLPDGQRLHLHDGPIDLIVKAFGERDEVAGAYSAAAQRFARVLDELCEELPILRSAAGPLKPMPTGIVARRMAEAVAPFAQHAFLTPMAAVAGAVAEEILGKMIAAASLSRAYVNNGGDIAVHLAPEQSFTIGMVERPDHPSLFGTLRLSASDSVRGIATSGWRGRSFSLGIADAVTILADRAAVADAAATIIANAVDLPEHTSIIRLPARDIAPDNDLGDRLVTQNVGELSVHEIDVALKAGVTVANRWIASGLVRAAALNLCGETRIAGAPDCECSFAFLDVAQTNAEAASA